MDIEKSNVEIMDEDARKLYTLGYKQVHSHCNFNILTYVSDT